MDFPYHTVEVCPQLVDVEPLFGRDEDARSIPLGHPAALNLVERQVFAGGGREVILLFRFVTEGVYLVENHEDRFVAGPYFAQRLPYYRYLFFEIRV